MISESESESKARTYFDMIMISDSKARSFETFSR